MLEPILAKISESEQPQTPPRPAEGVLRYRANGGLVPMLRSDGYQ